MSHAAQSLQHSAQDKLSRRFQIERDAYVTRASTVFPVRIRAHCDTLIVFLDYWRIKNNNTHVSIVLRLYDQNGYVVLAMPFGDIQTHNKISIKNLLQHQHILDDAQTFDGMIEVEVLSPKNLFYPFPALTAIYQSGALFSAVHAVGRTRNPSEPRRKTQSVETNWTCQNGPDITPFFHIYNGPLENGLGEVEIKLLDLAGREIARTVLDGELVRPFSSKIVQLNDIFDVKTLGLAAKTRDFFVSVSIPDTDIFPRLLVGNLHLRDDFLEVTHSFYWNSVGDDYLHQSDEGPDILSFIAATNTATTDLELAFFPTNVPGRAKACIYEAPVNGVLASTGEVLDFKTGGPGSTAFRHSVKDNVALTSFEVRGGPVPARLNASFRYHVKGHNQKYATDIATGGHAHVYPDKHFHWGHGLIARDVDTTIMVRNIAHRDDNNEIAPATLTVVDEHGRTHSHTFDIKPRSSVNIQVSDLIALPENLETISWYIHTSNPNVEAIWISANLKTGAICGEHAY
jgi:hypothetical protein